MAAAVTGATKQQNAHSAVLSKPLAWQLVGPQDSDTYGPHVP